ncbi:hypothetical protein Tco_0672481 [Tanacetum coccineum]
MLFYTSAGNPVKEILLKLNLPDHRLILTDSKDPALMRSGKLHYKIEFPYPTEEAKARILQDVFTEVIYDRRRWAPKNQGSTDPTNAEDYNNWPEDTLVRAV